MRNIIFILLAACLYSCKTAKNEIFTVEDVELSAGQLQRIPEFESAYISLHNVDVWLPPKYNPENQYATIYMLDGQMLFDANSTWNKQEWGVDEVLGQLISNGEVRPAIVVGIWNADESRHSEYFPQKPFEALSQKTRDSLLLQGNEEQRLFEQKVYSDNFLKFVVKELRPFINRNYATSTKAEDTFIMGSSMGGLISWYAVCEYPEVFGGAACLSTHWPGTFTAENNPIPTAFLNYLNRNLPSPENHRFYFDYGTETLDAMYEPLQQKADQIMKAHGFTEANWVTKKFQGADHSEKSWHERLHLPLEFLLKK